MYFIYFNNDVIIFSCNHIYSGRKRKRDTSKTKEKTTAKLCVKFHIPLSFAIDGQSLVLRMFYVHTKKLQCILVSTCIIHVACDNKGTKLHL